MCHNGRRVARSVKYLPLPLSPHGAQWNTETINAFLPPSAPPALTRGRACTKEVPISCETQVKHSSQQKSSKHKLESFLCCTDIHSYHVHFSKFANGFSPQICRVSDIRHQMHAWLLCIHNKLCCIPEKVKILWGDHLGQSWGLSEDSAFYIIKPAVSFCFLKISWKLVPICVFQWDV